ncbi:MAG TPA: ABC transporter permease [Ferruginibacter sp.]|nr:ABC transporter permease [Bacteroidota bacterium]MBS1925180.1 ABC transporter permease [Bacteroidota bacterium]MCC6692210.1 ABC transporter permease [Chitinophagaceae bacterium]HMT96545.1 ABC transporter permease [Ferruginibacter sp.]HMU23869.1 ABC transporter permease [Ferruginibacter sp.]
MTNGFNIAFNSLKLSLKELKVNKLRTALSLTGIAFGIFCIIGVLAAVNSLELNIQNELKGLGSNTVYIDKWDYSGGPDRPYWKLRARPAMKAEEAGLVKERTSALQYISFLMELRGPISYNNFENNSSTVYGVTESQMDIQPLHFYDGRFFSAAEFKSGSPVGILGYKNAEDFFGSPERAIGKQVNVKGRKVTIIGVLKKDGVNFIGWKFDDCIMLSYKFCRQVFNEDFSHTVLIAKGYPKVTPEALMQDLKGAMRQVRRLSPTQEDNFSLNSVQAFSAAITDFFSVLNIIGSIIGGISLIVGLFGIANIMFVTVKERTPVIGLKKAIGAKKGSILFEFLMEAVVLCLLGGAIGLLLVFAGTVISTRMLDFPIFISVPMLITSIIICVVVGVLAGIFPASRAARLDPVVAIRS